MAQQYYDIYYAYEALSSAKYSKKDVLIAFFQACPYFYLKKTEHFFNN